VSFFPPPTLLPAAAACAYAYVLSLRSLHRAPPSAAKCIKKSALTKEDLEAFAVEVQAMQMLSSHPNFVAYYDFFSEKWVRVESGMKPRWARGGVLGRFPDLAGQVQPERGR